MVSAPCNYFQVAFAAPVVIILALLFHLMPIGAEESGEAVGCTGWDAGTEGARDPRSRSAFG